MSVSLSVINVYVSVIGHLLLVYSNSLFVYHSSLYIQTLCVWSWFVYFKFLSVCLSVDLLVSVVGCAVALTLLFFVLWFFTNWYFLFLLIFGVAMGYIITTTILYTPLGKDLQWTRTLYLKSLGPGGVQIK